MSRLLIKKTILLSSSTLISRIFGFIRELVLPWYLGVGEGADAFLTAIRIPNALRNIFAEGALSAALVPTLVRVVKEHGRHVASVIVTRLFVIIECCIALLGGLLAWYATEVVHFLVPGWPIERIALATPLLQISTLFIVCIITSALLAAALQATHHYAIPSIAQIVVNICTIVGALLCLWYQWPIVTLAWFFVLGGLIMVGMHLVTYYRHDFTFSWSSLVTRKEVREVLTKLAPSIISVGMIEIIFIISNGFASYLPAGQISLFTYASNFMRLPLGVLAVPFANVAFLHFSRVSLYAPRRLSYYLLESSTLIFWIMVPIVLLMSFFAFDIFATLYKNFAYEHIVQAQWLLIIMLIGVFFFALNKIILNIFYALHNTFIPSMITLLGALINTMLDIVLMRFFGIYGLAWGQTMAAIAQTILFLMYAQRKLNIVLYGYHFMQFVTRALCQVLCIGSCGYGLFRLLRNWFANWPEPWGYFFTKSVGLWLWVGPLCCCLALMMWFTRKIFGIKMHFLNF